MLSVMPRCEFCKNVATRARSHYWFADNPDNLPEPVDLCEIHYSYIKPTSAKVNPVNIDRCMRCGCKSLNQSGDEQRLIDHHINYDLDVTVPVCDKCHSEIHQDEDRMYLERMERGESPYEPRGSNMATGHAVHELYRHDGRMRVDHDCPECGTHLLDMVEMGDHKMYICPNGECRETDLGINDVQR
jgi:hypothetical protein